MHPLTPRSRLESGLRCSFLHASRAPCDPQLPTRIRPQAFNFASPPCTLRIRPQALDLAPFRCAIRPPDPDWNPASSARFCTLPVHPATPSSRLESGLKRSIVHASRAPSDPNPDYNPASSARFCILPVHPANPSSRLESGLKRSILHASHAPSDPPIPTRIRPQVLILTRFPRTMRPPAPD